MPTKLIYLQNLSHFEKSKWFQKVMPMPDEPSIEKSEATREIPLLRTLNLIQATFLGVGTAIGGAMFAIMGRAVSVAGPSIVITFLIGAFFALLMGLTYAELGSSVPSGAGGAIAFAERAFGRKTPTFIAGWFSWVGSITDCAVGSVVFALSVSYFLKWIEPFSLAILTLIIFALVNFRGTRSMSIVQFALTGVLVFTLCFFIGGSSASFDANRFESLFPNGVSPMFSMVSFIFPTYAGYESITQMSEEVRTAGKNIPRALLLTLAFITLLFTGTAIAMVGGAPSEVYINSATPIQDAATFFAGPLGGAVVSVASIVAALTTINGAMAGGTRIALALGRYDFLPPVFKSVHSKYRSPFAALGLTTLLAALFVLTRSIDFIVYAISLGYSVTAIMVALALIRLRVTEPHLFRPFKIPLYPYTPIMAIAVLLFMIATMSLESLVLGIVFGGLGLLLLLTRRRISGRQKATETPEVGL